MAKRKRILKPQDPPSDPLIPDSSTELRFEYRDPKDIKVNAKNWRIHPRRQRQAYRAFKDQVGWAGAVLINETTGNLLDGHMRVDEAIKKNDPLVPCLIGNWTEQKENLILQNLDPLGALAATDREALASLTEANKKKLTDLSDENTRKLAQLTQDLKEHSQREESTPLIKQSKPIRKPKVEEPPEEEEDNVEADISYKPPESNRDIRREIIESEVYFESDDLFCELPLQLPSLQKHMLATPDMVPRQTFNRSKKQKHTPDTYYCVSSVPWPLEKTGGTIGFFTEDYRFNMCYDFAAKFLEELLEEDWDCVCLPDYSIYDDHPLPMQLWNLYRSRWCGRYWQEAGFKVIPIIQAFSISEDVDYTRELSINTLPDNCPVVACQTRGNSDYIQFCEDINYAVEAKNIQTVVIYGGADRHKVLHGYLTDKAEIIYLPSFMKARKQVLKTED